LLSAKIRHHRRGILTGHSEGGREGALPLRFVALLQ
jgi:hypothetical protein